MAALFSLLLGGLAALTLVVASIYAIEVLLGCAWSRKAIAQPASLNLGDRVAVLVPAHNEERGIQATLRDIRNNLGPADRLVVVADNCTDRTAELAIAEGADVTERSSADLRGKGYALAWGIAYLEADPPQTVVIIDADCRVSDGAIRELASISAARSRPVQGLYRMTAPPNAGVNQRIAEFAWAVKNHLRPLGLSAINGPCQLMGTGMAFPWTSIRSADLSSGQIVEDMKLGLDLARAGQAPVFHPGAAISSTFPSSVEGVRGQRQRWEHGHLGMIASEALPLLANGLLRRNRDQVLIGLDLLVPPLSLLCMLVGVVFSISAIAALAGLSAVAFTIAAGAGFVLTSATIAAWFVSGREILPAASLTRVPLYVLAKIPLYLKLFVGRGVSVWVRSDRA